MARFEKLFTHYDRLVLFDTETTGLQFSRDEIIEFAAVVVEQRDGEAVVVAEYDELVALNPGAHRHFYPGSAGAGHPQNPGLPGYCRTHRRKHAAAGLQCPF